MAHSTWPTNQQILRLLIFMYETHSSMFLPQSIADQRKKSPWSKAETPTQAHPHFVHSDGLPGVKNPSQGCLPLSWRKKQERWLSLLFPEHLRNHLPYCLGSQTAGQRTPSKSQGILRNAWCANAKIKGEHLSLILKPLYRKEW